MWPAPQAPAPPVPAPAPAPVAKDTVAAPEEAVVMSVDPKQEAVDNALKASVAVLAFAALGVSGQGHHDFTEMLSILTLACLGGYQLVYGVAPALHSPLMSVTNAISGMTAVGGMVMLGGGLLPETPQQVLGALAVLISTVNIVGGFRVS
ncbi:unnamed protein product, partial [Choristocarpus tenellus]